MENAVKRAKVGGPFQLGKEILGAPEDGWDSSKKPLCA
jgi:hypothetical protein